MTFGQKQKPQCCGHNALLPVMYTKGLGVKYSEDQLAFGKVAEKNVVFLTQCTNDNLNTLRHLHNIFATYHSYQKSFVICHLSSSQTLNHNKWSHSTETNLRSNFMLGLI